MVKAKSKNYEIDMLNGPILSRMLKFTVPLMCSSILQILFNAADIVVIGRFAGPTALAAVGSNTALINLVTNLFIGLSIGANVVVARYFGAKDNDNVSQAVHTSIALGIVSGIILTVTGLFGARFFLRLMLSPEDVLPKATVYLRIYFLGMVPMMVYNFGSAILRAVGDTKRPLYYLMFAGVLNVILNLLFVLVFHLEVAGVA
ncbi:MAG: polysaccharide biosynthesis C-terminal domain-containing protein, partial [Spirochaetaceae bacterium]|nr:polysaccharide biosynthesis C-terminal domain-containing protein [Spirochaetaceae bacterium]